MNCALAILWITMCLFHQVTVSTVDRRKMPLVFKAIIVEMDGKILVDFRLSKGCGLEFKRRFVKIKRSLDDVILKGPVTWPIAVATQSMPWPCGSRAAWYFLYCVLFKSCSPNKMYACFFIFSNNHCRWITHLTISERISDWLSIIRLKSHCFYLHRSWIKFIRKLFETREGGRGAAYRLSRIHTLAEADKKRTRLSLKFIPVALVMASFRARLPSRISSFLVRVCEPPWVPVFRVYAEFLLGFDSVSFRPRAPDSGELCRDGTWGRWGQWRKDCSAWTTGWIAPAADRGRAGSLPPTVVCASGNYGSLPIRILIHPLISFSVRSKFTLIAFFLAWLCSCSKIPYPVLNW